jgi:hypothetical protein
MSDIYMTQEDGRKLTRLIIGGLVMILALTAVVFAQSYFGRKNLEKAEQKARDALVVSQRAGCQRNKKDRRANALGWRTAQAARSSTLADKLKIPLKEIENLISQSSKPDDPADLVAVRRYNKIAHELEKRSEINCARAFPK